MEWRPDYTGGIPCSELRLCPACGRVGNVDQCGPHKNVQPVFALTIRHPDDAAQTAFVIGGLQSACELLKNIGKL